MTRAPSVLSGFTQPPRQPYRTTPSAGGRRSQARSPLNDILSRIGQIQRAPGLADILSQVQSQYAASGNAALSPATLTSYNRAVQQGAASARPTEYGASVTTQPTFAGLAPTKLGRQEAAFQRERRGITPLRPGPGAATGVGALSGILYGTWDEREPPERAGLSEEDVARANARMQMRRHLRGDEMTPPAPEVAQAAGPISQADIQAGPVFGLGASVPPAMRELLRDRRAERRGVPIPGLEPKPTPAGPEPGDFVSRMFPPQQAARQLTPRELVAQRGIAKDKARQQRLLSRGQGPSQQDMLFYRLIGRDPEAAMQFAIQRGIQQLKREQMEQQLGLRSKELMLGALGEQGRQELGRTEQERLREEGQALSLFREKGLTQTAEQAELERTARAEQAEFERTARAAEGLAGRTHELGMAESERGFRMPYEERRTAAAEAQAEAGRAEQDLARQRFEREGDPERVMQAMFAPLLANATPETLPQIMAIMPQLQRLLQPIIAPGGQPLLAGGPGGAAAPPMPWNALGGLEPEAKAQTIEEFLTGIMGSEMSQEQMQQQAAMRGIPLEELRDYQAEMQSQVRAPEWLRDFLGTFPSKEPLVALQMPALAPLFNWGVAERFGPKAKRRREKEAGRRRALEMLLPQ